MCFMPVQPHINPAVLLALGMLWIDRYHVHMSTWPGGHRRKKWGKSPSWAAVGSEGSGRGQRLEAGAQSTETMGMRI